jgi:hypothetical protein
VVPYWNIAFKRTIPNEICALARKTVVCSWITLSTFSAREHAFVLLWRSDNRFAFARFVTRIWVWLYDARATWTAMASWIKALCFGILTNDPKSDMGRKIWVIAKVHV